VIYISPKVERAKSRGGENMTWFQAFKIAFWGGRTNQATGQTRRQPPASLTRDVTTTEDLG